MKFGMFYPVAVARDIELGKGFWGLDRRRYRQTIEDLREQAIAADETGWTSMMFAEHHFEIEGYHVTPNPLMLNVYLAQHTKRLRQGQMGLVLPNWNPLRLAEDIAMADHLTGGRLDVGLSRGYQPRSVGVMGQHVHANAAGTGRAEVEALNRRVVEEWFEVMRRSWTEDLWEFQGEFIKVPPPGLEWKHPVSARLKAGVDNGILEQVATVPKPKQLPHPPLFTTLSQSPETLARLTGDRRTLSDEIGPSYPLWATAAGRALLASVAPVLRPALLPPEPFPRFTPNTKTRWAEISAALAEAQHDGIHAEEGEIDPRLACYATPLPRARSTEKLALAISFETGRPERDRDAMRQALRREWREIAKGI